MADQFKSTGGGSGTSGSVSNADSGGGGGSILPSWLSSLKVLAPVAGTLAAIATGNLAAIQDAIISVVLEWFVAGLLSFLGEITGLVLDAFGIAAEAPLLAISGLLTAGGAAGQALFVALGGVLDALFGVAAAAGPFEPIVLVLYGVAAYVVAETLLDLLLARIFGAPAMALNPLGWFR